MAENTSSPARVRLRVLAVAVIVVLGFFLVKHFIHGSVLVRTAAARRGDLAATTSTNGIVEPIKDFEAHSPVAAEVKAVYVHEGDQAKAGELLLTMDDSPARAALASAAASLKGAQADLASIKSGGTQDERLGFGGQLAQAEQARNQAAASLATLKRLQSEGSASSSEVADATNRLASAEATLRTYQQRKTGRYAALDVQHSEANLSNAQAAYSAAEDTLAHANVRAPFTGTVYSLPVHTTEFVQAGDKLLEMADLSQLQVRAYFDEPEIGRLAEGQPVTITWDARPGESWHGHIVHTPSTIIHYGTRSVGEALVSVDDPTPVLIPSVNVTVTVTYFKHTDVIAIPREALHQDSKGNYVYAVRAGKLRRENISVGAVNMTEVEVTSGLAENSNVALGALDGTPLTDGLAVRVGQ